MRTTKKCTKNYNARAQPLYCSLNLFFSDCYRRSLTQETRDKWINLQSNAKRELLFVFEETPFSVLTSLKMCTSLRNTKLSGKLTAISFVLSLSVYPPIVNPTLLNSLCFFSASPYQHQPSIQQLSHFSVMFTF